MILNTQSNTVSYDIGFNMQAHFSISIIYVVPSSMVTAALLLEAKDIPVSFSLAVQW